MRYTLFGVTLLAMVSVVFWMTKSETSAKESVTAEKIVAPSVVPTTTAPKTTAAKATVTDAPKTTVVSSTKPSTAAVGSASKDSAVPKTTPAKESAAPKAGVTPAVTSPVIHDCLISLIEGKVEVPARESGVILTLEATEGMEVKAKETLGRIDDRQPELEKEAKKAEYESAKEQAESDIEVRFAKASSEVADAAYQKALYANKITPKSIVEVELNRLKLDWHKAVLQIEKAQIDRTVAAFTSIVKEAEMNAADLSIDRRRIESPLDGVVTEVYRHKGEWVAPGDRILKIVRLDKLRIEGRLNASEYDPYEIEGRPVTVDVELARGRKVSFQGKIAFVSPEVRTGGEYRVFAEVKNREEGGQWVLRPGLLVTMTIHLK